MLFRVAVASSDGKVVNQHFGHAQFFIIFDVKSEADFVFIEERKTNPPCGFGEHDKSTLEEAVDRISDCNYVLCYQIGKGASAILSERGISAYVIGDYISNALYKLWSIVMPTHCTS